MIRIVGRRDMSHELVRGIYGSYKSDIVVPPWHFGETGKNGRAILKVGLWETEEAIRTVGMDYGVHKTPLYVCYNGEYLQVEDYIAVTKTDDPKVLGIHTDLYEPDNFVDQIRGIASMFEEGAEIWDSMIRLRNDKMFAGTIRLPDLDKTLIDGTTLAAALVVYASHDGTFGINYKDSPWRVDCANMTRALDAMTTGRFVGVKHMNGKDEKKRDAERMMSYAQERMDAIAKQAEELVNKKIENDKVVELLQKWFPYNEDSDRSKGMAVNKQWEVFSHYQTAPDLADVNGTAWGVYNAMTHYVTHVARFKKSKQGTSNDNKFIATMIKNNTVADVALRDLIAL
jgi:phage/plasmid-like protein (TIGR03299 family)